MAKTDLVGSARAVFTITLTQAAEEPVIVNWRTQDGTAIVDRDYVANSGTLTFAPGETSKAVEVIVLGRTIETEDRIFYVMLDTPINAILQDQAIACVIRVDVQNSRPILAVIYPRGDRGLSAYEVALQQGFVGTEDQWLLSLIDFQHLTDLVMPRIDYQGLAPLVAQYVDLNVFPPMTGNDGRFLGLVNGQKAWLSPFRVGDIMYSASIPGVEWADCNGAIYQQAANPELYGRLGLISDGKGIWTQKSLPVKSSVDHLIAVLNGVLFTSYSTSVNSVNKITVSSTRDGENWSSPFVLDGGANPSGMAAGGGVVAVLAGGKFANSNWIAYTSNGGAAWSYSLPNIDSQITGSSKLKYLNGYFILTVNNGIYYSRDCASWTYKAIASGVVADCAYSNGVYLFVVAGVVWSMTDLTGTAVNRGATGQLLAAGNGKVGVFDTNGRLQVSQDNGITWAAATTGNGGVTNGWYFSATYFIADCLRGVFILCADAGSASTPSIFVSTDLVSWTNQRVPAATAFGFKSIALFGAYAELAGNPTFRWESSLVVFDPSKEFALPIISPPAGALVGNIKPYIKVK